MGGSGSSSKRKSSKKKRDKVSSQKKKSGRKESKKRLHIYDSDDSVNSEHTLASASKSDHGRRANKHKKLRRDYSVSSYSDDLSSDSMSSYDTGYKRRKSRRSRISLKSKKKRARKRSASPDNAADARNVRKRKILDRDRVVKRKKKSSKKKSRKHLSSSSSSDSESDSTCKTRSSSSNSDGKHRRSKVTLNNEIERFRGRESYKTQKKRKERSPSCSSFHSDGDHSLSVDHSIRPLPPLVNNSRRLKSVIAVINQPYDEGENRYEKDPHKEEIVYDQEDYPSPKSMDSNEGSKMELDYHSHHASNKRNCLENFEGEEATERRKSGINGGDKKNASDSQSDGANTNNFEEEKEIDVPVPAADDLESILRQKALENLRKFRGRLQSSPRNTNLEKNNESDVNRSSTRGVDDIQNKSTNRGGFNDQEMNQSSGNLLKRDSSPLKVVKQPSVNMTVAHSLEVAAALECSEEDKGTSFQAVSGKAASRSEASPGVGVTKACSSTAEPACSARPISAEPSSERQNEAKDGSQFEQKTMSVMRGGEMVQVSYKVYIPKKAPALARRQLKK